MPGGELIRLLVHHSTAEVVCATSRKLAGTPLDQVHPHLKGFTDLKFENPETDAIDADVAFLAVPHTAAMTYAGKLLSRGIKVVDLSADYRLAKGCLRKDVRRYPHGLFPCTVRHPRDPPQGLHQCKVRCKPRLLPHRGNPCSSAARKIRAYRDLRFQDRRQRGGDNPSATTHYPNVGDNVGPYKLTTHRHLAEMKQELAFLGVEGKGLLHPPPRPGQPGHPDHCPYPAQRTPGAERGGEALPGLLQGTSTSCGTRSRPLPQSAGATSAISWSRARDCVSWQYQPSTISSKGQAARQSRT